MHALVEPAGSVAGPAVAALERLGVDREAVLLGRVELVLGPARHREAAHCEPRAADLESQEVLEERRPVVIEELRDVALESFAGRAPDDALECPAVTLGRDDAAGVLARGRDAVAL